MTRWKVGFTVGFTLLFCSTPLSAKDQQGRQTQALNVVSQSDVERRMLETMPNVRAAEQDAVAAHEQARSQYGRLFPELRFDVNLRYVTEVPDIPFGPTPLPFGDNESYSIGPYISYMLFDGGGRRSTYRSLSLLADARHFQSDAVTQQALLSVRLAYIQVQLSQQERDFVAQSLELARIQARDVRSRFQIGSASRLDLLNAENEISTYELRVAQARADYEVAFADLEAMTGDLGDPNAIVLDRLEQSAEMASDNAPQTPSSASPALLAQIKTADSRSQALRSQAAELWPTIFVQARASLDYPNGPSLAQVRQSTFMVHLEWPLFEGGRIKAAIRQKAAETEAARLRREQTEFDLARDWEKARARYQSLLDQRTNSRQIVRQSEELARLNYSTFRAGRLSFVDVQTANLNLLDSRIRAARVDAQLLTQYQTLRYLAEDAR